MKLMVRWMVVATAAGLVASGGGCGVAWDMGGQAVKGNGKMTQEVRKVEDFTSIELGAAIEATVSYGEETTLRVSADENILPLVKTRVHDGRLIVGIERGGSRLRSRSG